MINNVVLVSGIHKSDSAIHIHVSILREKYDITSMWNLGKKDTNELIYKTNSQT